MRSSIERLIISATFPLSCHYCGEFHLGYCPMVKSITHFPDGLVEVEFFQITTSNPSTNHSSEQNLDKYESRMSK